MAAVHRDGGRGDMRIEEANAIRHTMKEIQCIEGELLRCKSDNEELLKSRRELLLNKLQFERAKFYEFLESVEDPETRLIIHLRCISNYTWTQIGLHTGMDRTTASRKYKDFFKKNKVAHNPHSNKLK